MEQTVHQEQVEVLVPQEAQEHQEQAEVQEQVEL
jgi:hypothetical protein